MVIVMDEFYHAHIQYICQRRFKLTVIGFYQDGNSHGRNLRYSILCTTSSCANVIHSYNRWHARVDPVGEVGGVDDSLESYTPTCERAYQNRTLRLRSVQALGVLSPHDQEFVNKITSCQAILRTAASA